MKSNMSILKKKPLLSRLLSSHNSQEELNEEHVMTPPTIVINDTEDCEESENIWMDNIEKNSISSEHSSESIVTCHINEKQMTNQQLWNIEEIVQALSNLPAGEHALSLIPTLHGDTLRNCLDEFLNTDLNEVTLKNQKTTISSFANGHIQNTSLSIENEAAANATASQLFTRWPNTCLLVSCYLCHLDLVKALLSKNAKVTARDSDGRTPLHLAACAGSVKIIEELLKYGANPCEWDYNKKCTPLHCAAATGDFASVKCLIKSRADVNAGLSGKSPLYYAVVSNAADCVEALLQAGASPNNPQVYTETPLHVAASLGSVTCMKLLLSYGADVRVQFSSMRSTPLHLAAEEGSAECTKLLLDAGAACEVKNARGQAPMHLAALSQSAETLETLINFGATVSTEDNDGRTPLHAAVAKVTRGIELVKILIQAGALINKADKFGYTPLHIAALNESSSTVMMLLSRGADVTARTKGFSVLHKNYKSFSNPLVGLLKTIIMMSGELEFEDVFFDEDAPILYSGTAHLMLLSFVILVTVILTNLMMGLAVSDIQELRRCAGLDRLVRRAELVAHLESMLFSKLLDHAPKRIVKACRQGALLLHPPHHCAIHIRPNDPREKRLPRDLIKAVYHLVSERKNRYINTKTTYTRNSNSTETGQFRLSRLYSTTSTNDNSQQLNEVVTELKRCSYNISAHLDNLTNKVENIARDYYN
ncbi:transient receptor potential channel pyrexia isoform X5 [Osmia bicornis bicornis]|uniref:transient receptor potential channel pyrexia isoform X5 n=1 Tax=Osmia bicornis bicornis TaxID=1437191 RepID=UPI0010F7707A|nr:transient receptor potential channel pyrexia isoform X5 [Osmia bicornis bicornis]